MDVMSPSKDALGPPFSIDYWFYYIIMLFGGVRVEKQKCQVTKCHLVELSASNDVPTNMFGTILIDLGRPEGRKSAKIAEISTCLVTPKSGIFDLFVKEGPPDF